MTRSHEHQPGRVELRGSAKILFVVVAALPLVVGMIYMAFKPAPAKVPRHIPPPISSTPDAGSGSDGALTDGN